MKKVKVVLMLVFLGLILLTGCVDMVTVNLLPDAEGTVQQWTPSPLGLIHWDKVDDPVGFPDEDATYVWTGTINDIEEFNHQTSVLLIGANITNVRVNVRAKSQFVLNEINIGVTVAGRRYGAAVDTALTGFYADYFKDLAINPATLISWTKADIDNLQSSIQSKALGVWVRVTQVYLTVTFTPVTPVAGKGLVSWTP